ncbi:MAG: hypothetical protein VB861_20015, partial [Planctomycetaceae bacterium]
HLGDDSEGTNSALIPLGDLNGDGYADFVFAVQDDYDLRGTDSGLAAGFPHHPHEYRGPSTALIHLSNADADDPMAEATTVSLTLPAPVLKHSHGVRSIFAPPADYNGDGIDDLAVLVTRGESHDYGADLIYYPGSGVYVLEGGENWDTVTQRDLLQESDATIVGLVNPVSLANGNLLENDQDDNNSLEYVAELDELVIGQDTAGTPVLESVFVVASPTGPVWTDASGVYFYAGLDDDAGDLAPVADNEGLWHLSQGRGEDYFHSGEQSFYYGTGESETEFGDFNVGRTMGVLRSSPIEITERVTDLKLSFQYFLETESSTNWDKAEVHVLIDGTTPAGGGIVADRTGSKSATLDQTSDPAGNANLKSWKQASISLGPVNGTPEVPVTVTIEFVFDSGDAIMNSYEGWYVDDVMLYAASYAADISEAIYSGAVSHVVTADLDGDGSADLAAMPGRSPLADGHLYVVGGPLPLVANGLIDITSAANHTQDIVVPAYDSARPVAAGSLDGDANEDLLISMVYAGESSESSVIVWGSAAGNAVLDQAPHDQGVGLLIPLGDLDGDGAAEVAVSAMEETSAVDPTQDSTWHSVFQVLMGGGRVPGMHSSDRWLPLPLDEETPDLRLQDPDLVVEPGRPVYHDNDTPDSSRARIAGLGDVDGDGTFNDFGVADFLADTSHILVGGSFGDASALDTTSLEPEPFRFEPTTPQLDVVHPREGLDLNVPLDPETEAGYDIRRAYRIEGSSDDEQLTRFEPIGDFNRDGYEDFLAVGSDAAYVLLGPVNLDEIHDVRERAEIIIDLEGLGAPQTSGSGDITGDGYDDILFVSSTMVTSQVALFTVQVIPGDAYPERFLDQSHATALRYFDASVTAVDAVRIDHADSLVHEGWVHV